MLARTLVRFVFHELFDTSHVTGNLPKLVLMFTIFKKLFKSKMMRRWYRSQRSNNESDSISVRLPENEMYYFWTIKITVRKVVGCK